MGYDYIELRVLRWRLNPGGTRSSLQEKIIGLPVLGFNAFSAGQPAIVGLLRPGHCSTRVGLFSGAGGGIVNLGSEGPAARGCPQRFPAMRPPVS